MCFQPPTSIYIYITIYYQILPDITRYYQILPLYYTIIFPLYHYIGHILYYHYIIPFIDISPRFHPATVILQGLLRLQQQLLHIRHVALQRGRRRLRGADGGAVVGDLFAARGFEIGTCLPCWACWAKGFSGLFNGFLVFKTPKNGFSMVFNCFFNVFWFSGN